MTCKAIKLSAKAYVASKCSGGVGTLGSAGKNKSFLESMSNINYQLRSWRSLPRLHVKSDCQASFRH